MYSIVYEEVDTVGTRMLAWMVFLFQLGRALLTLYKMYKFALGLPVDNPQSNRTLAFKSPTFLY